MTNKKEEEKKIHTVKSILSKKKDTKKAKKDNKKPEKKGIMSFVTLIIVAIIIASLLPYLKDKEQFSDTKDVSLTQLEQNFKQEKYSEILID
jgi:hypothetical protein